MGVGGVGDWEGVSDVGGKLNVNTFKRSRNKKIELSKFCIFLLKKSTYLPKNPMFIVKKTENRPEYSDFDFLLGNLPTCSEY